MTLEQTVKENKQSFRKTLMLASQRKFLILPVVSLLMGYFFVKAMHEPWTLAVEKSCQDGDQTNLPKPLIIYVGGGGRTGTTYMYNLVRIILRQRDPNTIAGWYPDLSMVANRYATPNPPNSPVMDDNEDDYDAWNGAMDAYNSTGTTVLVKVHSLSHGLRLFSGCMEDKEFQDPSCPVDLIFQSHRDLGPQMASLKRMGWARVLHEYELKDPAQFCRKEQKHLFPRRRLVEKDWEDVNVWKVHARASVICHREWHKAAGPKLAVDMPMEDLATYEQRLALAQKIVAAVKQLDPNSQMDAAAAVKEADLLRPLSCNSWQAVNPITHFHRGHVSHSHDNSDPNQIKGFNAIREDPMLQKWRQEYGYAVPSA